MLSVKGAKKEDRHITIKGNNEREVLEIFIRGLKASRGRKYERKAFAEAYYSQFETIFVDWT